MQSVNSVTRLVAIVLVLFACASAPIFAAEAGALQASQYSLGDQTMSINAGLFIPLFLLPGGMFFLDHKPPQLSFGAVGTIGWAAYVTPQIRVGAEIGGNFTLSPNDNVLLMLPIVGKVSYSFTIYPFEIPLSLGMGMNILKYVDQSSIDFLLRPGVSFYWIYNSSWSFGANLLYWFDMQFSTTPGANRYGSFLEFSLGVLYHF